MTPEAQQMKLQRLMTDYQRDSENFNQELSLERDRQMGDLQAKLAARKNRKLKESRRRAEEEEAQRIISEQNKQMRQGGSGPQPTDVDLAHVPQVNYGESSEEKALKKEQVN